MTEQSRFPMDFDALERGSIVTFAEQLEIFAIKDPSTLPTVGEALDANNKIWKYQLRLVSLIKKHFDKERGLRVQVAIRNRNIHILTPPEQDENSQHRYQQAKRKLVDAFAYDLGNDPMGLSDEQQKARDERLRVVSWHLLQLRKRPPPRLTEGDAT